MKKNKLIQEKLHLKQWRSRVLFLAFLVNVSISAQSKFSISLSGGLNDNSITYSASNRVDTEYIGKSGNYIKAGFNLKIYNNISIQTGLTYLDKNYQFQRTNTREGIYTFYDTKYFNVPIMVGIQPLHKLLKNTKFNFEVFAGAYIGWWNSLNREATVQVFSELTLDNKYPRKKVTESYDFSTNENHFNRFDFGLQAETRLGYNFYRNFNVFLEYSLMYGLTDNQKHQLRKTSRYYYTTSNYGIGLSYNF